MEERLPRVRRRADQRGREEGRCDAAHACAEVRPARYLGTTDIAHGSRAQCASVSTHTAPSPSGPSPHMRRPTQAIHLTHEVRSMPLAPWSSGRGLGGGDGRSDTRECGRCRIARIVSQGFHRLFGGECSGSSGYIVVAAGREDSRGLGSPMTEFLPRRPRVLGSPRSVALAKEGVPPEWEPGCGAPRRRRPVGRERQPGATGHVIFGRRGGTQSRWQSRQQK